MASNISVPIIDRDDAGTSHAAKARVAAPCVAGAVSAPRLDDLSRCVAAARAEIEASCNAEGISWRQLRLLAVICDHPGAIQRELAAQSGINQTVIGPVLARLIENGDLQIVAAKTNRRRGRAYCPTPKGIALVEAIGATIAGVEARLLDQIDNIRKSSPAR